MASPTLIDVATRTATMAEGKKNWVKKAIKHPGAFKAKAEQAGKSTREFAKEHAGDSGKTGQQARLANTLMGMNKRKSKMYGHPSSSRMD